MTEPTKAPTPTSPASTASAPRIEVSAADLPLYCPRPDAPLWSAHPRVFLEIEENGEARCPYCGTLYALKRG